MFEKINKIKLTIFAIILALLATLLFLGLVLKMEIILPLAILVSLSILIYFSISYIERNYENNSKNVVNVLGDGINEALNYGEVGVLTYDDDYVITWMSDLFYKRNLDRVNKKILAWLPEVNGLISGEEDEVEVIINDETYLVRRKENAPLLFFKEISELHDISNQYDHEKLVVGLVHLDNYEETTQYQDEQEISYLNNYIRQPVIDWCKSKGMIVKSLKSNRIFLVLNEQIYESLVDDRFSILNTTRKTSRKTDVAITLSMAFARGTNNFNELDEMCNALLELAQSRGGDQVAVRKYGEDVKFFGGSSEAQEKRSKVRVRVMAHTLRDLIRKSSNVIICGHKEMDADCVGAAICMSDIAQAFGKQVCIIGKTGGIEPVIKDVLEKYKNEVYTKHLFVTEGEAINQLRNESLVIMVDHHNIETSNGSQLLQKAKKIAIFDHHRRKADLGINPILVYVEASASSSCELCTEFIPYIRANVEITPIEANIMYLGLLIDTNHFKVRTGSRTFDVASQLRIFGADPVLCDELLKEPIEQFDIKNRILSNAKLFTDGIIIAACDDEYIYSRTVISQVADQLLSIKDVDASFIIAHTSNDEVGISARSNGYINVQIVMERMHGGGHLTASACQRKNETIANMKEELINTLEVYLKEEETDESNIVG